MQTDYLPLSRAVGGNRLGDSRCDRIVADVRRSGVEEAVTVEPDVSTTGFVAMPVHGPATARTRYLPARTIGGATVQPQFRGSVFGYAVLRPSKPVSWLISPLGW